MDLKSKKVKIIVGRFDDSRAREVMCQAFRLDMTAKEGYVWFLPALTPLWYDIDGRKNLTVEQNDADDTERVEELPVSCTTQEMIEVLQI